MTQCCRWKLSPCLWLKLQVENIKVKGQSRVWEKVKVNGWWFFWESPQTPAESAEQLGDSRGDEKAVVTSQENGIMSSIIWRRAITYLYMWIAFGFCIHLLYGIPWIQCCCTLFPLMCVCRQLFVCGKICCFLSTSSCEGTQCYKQ